MNRITNLLNMFEPRVKKKVTTKSILYFLIIKKNDFVNHYTVTFSPPEEDHMVHDRNQHVVRYSGRGNPHKSFHIRVRILI